MFEAIYTRVLQHLVSQNSWANALLQPFAGKSVRLDFILTNTALVILEDGNLAVAGETNIPDATVTISPGVLMRLIAKDEAAKLLITVEGDTHLATELAKVFSNMRWDYEDDFSKLVGDVPAHKIGERVRQAATTAKETGTNLTGMLREYWQEEMPLIAKKRHVEQFNREVDILRADVDRLEKKLTKLSQKFAKKTDASDTNK